MRKLRKLPEPPNEADQCLAADRFAGLRAVLGRMVWWVCMIPALVILSGMIVATVSGLAPAESIALGVVAGLTAIFVETRWPGLKPTYVAPAVRSQPLTKKKLTTIAVTMVAIGAFGLFVGQAMAPRPPEQSMAFFFAGTAITMGFGIMLTARRMIDAHNARLASMSPKLDTAQ